MGGVGGVLHDTFCFAGASCKENIQDGGERGTNDFCSGVHCPLEGLAVCCTTVPVPDSDAAGQHALNGTPVEGGEDGHNILCITSTGLNLINCNHNHYSPSSTLLLCVHPRYNPFAHSHALHTLSHCTSYPLFYFIICFLLHSHHICIYIYSLVFLFHSFYCFYVIFILLSCFIFSFLHFPLSGPVLTNISLPIIPCMIVYVTNNKEP